MDECDRPLLERGSALRAVDELIDRTRAGDGPILVVTAPAGLGKTTLLAEAARRGAAAGLGLLTVRGRELEREISGGTARLLFGRALARMNPAALDETLGRLPTAVSALLDERFPLPSTATDLRTTLHGLFTLADGLTGDGAWLVVVDDVHWADELTLRFVDYLAERLDDTRLGLLVASRPGEAVSSAVLDHIILQPRAVELALAPLSVEAVGTLSRNALGSLADGEVVKRVFEITRGNPFFVEETLGSVVAPLNAGLDSATIRERLSGTSPLTIARHSLHRVGVPGSATAHLARAVAVLGEGTKLDQAADLAGLSLGAAAEAAEVLVRRGVLDDQVTLAFSHPLVRAAVYEDIPASVRAVRHRRAAELLHDAGAPPEVVAAQLLNAPVSGEAWVGAVLVTAARTASGRSGLVGGLPILERALEEGPRGADRIEVLCLLAGAEADAGRNDGTARLAEAMELAETPQAKAAVALQLGMRQLMVDQHVEATRTLRLAIDDAPVDDEMSLQIGATYLIAATYSPHTRQAAFEWASRLVAGAEQSAASRHVDAILALRAAEVGSPYAEVDGLCTRAWQDGLLLQDAGPDGLTWRLLAWARLMVADPGPAVRIAEAALDHARQTHSSSSHLNGLLWRANAAQATGDISTAAADIDYVLHAVAAGHWNETRGFAAATAANVAIDRGDLAAADAALTVGGDPAQMKALGAPFLLSARGRLRAARGDLPGALEDQMTAGRILTEEFFADHTAVLWRLRAALACLSLGDTPQAELISERETALAAAVGGPGLLGRAAYLRGRVTDSVDDLELAASLLDTAELRLLAVDARLALGRALRQREFRDGAKAQFRIALECATRLGATPRAEYARAELSTLGVRPRRTALSGADSLTPTEHLIAKLARDGNSNRDIATHQFITIKAVEWHLRNVYRKLGISRRPELRIALTASGEASQG